MNKENRIEREFKEINRKLKEELWRGVWEAIILTIALMTVFLLGYLFNSFNSLIGFVFA